MKIVLASESPFRRRALDLLGLDYEISPSRIDESAIRDDDPVTLTRKLAEAKAQKVASEYPDAVIISGDAVVSKTKRSMKNHTARTKQLNF
jgi:septum formation protein